jgi:DNA-binding HxlR family transcriptional regulator
MRTKTPYEPSNAACSIERSLAVLGERWALLIVREAHAGATRFAEFQQRLRISPDVLSARLETLVAAGVLEKRDVRAPGERGRSAYCLTRAGTQLRLVLGALQQWGDEYLRPHDDPKFLRRSVPDGRPVRVAFVDSDNAAHDPADVSISVPASGKHVESAGTS